jgi:hypothetical protein
MRGEYRAYRWTEDFLLIGDRDIVIHNLLHTSISLIIVTAMLIYFFEWRMFSRWIVTNITSVRGTLYCHKTRILCGDQLVICGQNFYFGDDILADS